MIETKEDESKMKIGLLIPSFPEQTHIAMWRVGNSIRNNGFEVNFISTKKPSIDKQCHDILKKEMKNTFYLYPPKIKFILKNLFKIKKLKKMISYILKLEESNIYEKIKSITYLLFSFNLLEYSKRKKIDHIFVHSCAKSAHIVALCYLLGGPQYSLRLGGNLCVYGKYHQSKMKYAKFIVPASKKTKKEIIEKLRIDAKKIYPAWLGVDTKKFKKTELKKYIKNKIHLVTIARLNWAKGHIYALNAIKKAIKKGININYTIAGSGPYKEEIIKKIKKLNLEKNVRLVGAIDEKKCIKLLHNADVFILPSIGKGEDSPVAVIEAMSCGVPTICSIIGGTPYMINDKKNGFLIKQKDEKKMVKLLVKLGKDINLRKKISIECRKTAVNKFDCENTAKKIIQLIKKKSI